jgi:serine/threonine protein kinase
MRVFEQLFGMSSGDPHKTFTFQKALGKGAFGEVMKATGKQTKQTVAMKRVSCMDTAHQEIVLKEVQHMKKCYSHENIIQYRGLYHVGPYMWISMECVEGIHCGTLIESTALLSKQISCIVKQVLTGLQYLHNELAIVHRDIKPTNIMLSVTGHVKIIDLGLSTKVSEEKCVGGSLNFLAPEVLSSTDYDELVDIWSLGICISYMAERRDPYEGKYKTQAELRSIIKQGLFIPKLPLDRPRPMKNFLGVCMLDRHNRADATKLLTHGWLSIASQTEEIGSLVKRALLL